MIRVIAYIDGFNLYHSIIETRKNAYKWLNLNTLVYAFISPKNEQLIEIKYFSAYAYFRDTHHERTTDRHKRLIKANRMMAIGYNFNPIMGKYKSKDKTCPQCKNKFVYHEEKETDVNIAIHLIVDAYEDKYDKAIIITGDTDIKPAIQFIKKKFKNKQIHIVFPYNRSNDELKTICDKYSKLKEDHYKTNQLPEKLNIGNGKWLTRPEKWK